MRSFQDMIGGLDICDMVGRTIKIKDTHITLDILKVVNPTIELRGVIPYKIVMFDNTHAVAVTRSVTDDWSNYELLPTGGRLIYIEGVDAAGKATQTNLLAEYFRSKKLVVDIFSYPKYDSPTGKQVSSYLNGEFGDVLDVNYRLSSSLYALDRAADIPAIKEALARNHIVILDRSPYSNSAFQAGKRDILNNTDHSDLTLFHELAEIEFYVQFPRPDVVYYLDAPLDISKSNMENKDRDTIAKDDSGKDGHEACDPILVAAREKYVAASKTIDNWELIPVSDGNGILPRETIHEMIRTHYNEFLA